MWKEKRGNGNHIKLVCKTIYLILQTEAKCRLNQRKSKYFVLYMVNYNFFSFLSYSLGANHNNDNILGIYVVR